MPWIAITPEDLNDTKLAPLMSALRTAVLAEGQSDPVSTYITNAVNRTRRMISACRTNQVDADETTVPESLKDLVCRMVVRAAKDRLEIELTQTEQEAWRVDERELTRISNCEIPIETSANSEAPAVQATQPGPKISGRKKRFSREQQEGA